ncbi:MAG: hypothetical protein II783_07350, partial [Erysipelotrichales bacterium]|nr:hypothetical protein [Erysipelotrichales bacterium]
MGSYIPSTEQQRKEMLEKAGFSSFDELYADVPAEVKLAKELHLPS